MNARGALQNFFSYCDFCKQVTKRRDAERQRCIEAQQNSQAKTQQENMHASPKQQ